MTKFEQKVLKFCRKIPQGKVSTYKILAQAVGRPKAARAVGNALNKNKMPIKVPCHRIVKSNGQVGGYVKGQNSKIKLLRNELIKIKNGLIDLNSYLYPAPEKYKKL